MSNKLRLRFAKTGTAKFISHLDLMATMRRGLLRAGVELKYSEGFNPHPYMSVALPLSVGMSSACELIDIGLSTDYFPPDDLAQRTTSVLPEGIVIERAYVPQRKFSQIDWVEIQGIFHYDVPVENAANSLAMSFMRQSIVVSKRSKSGVCDIDIVPHIKRIDFSGDSEILLSAVISAQNPTLSPENLLAALSGEYAGLKPDFAAFTRIEIFDSEMNVFL